MQMGRPSTFDQAIADELCESVACGDSMREAARKQGLNEATVRLWRKNHEAFAAQYAHAVTARAEVFFERGNDIAMAISSGEEAQIARVQLDWLKWSASKLGPKQYGDKVQQEISGPGGGAIPVSLEIDL